ncbi:putative bifunctional diguanylate cyclase/phosphodiesterase [Shewanella cyperi]|uniref:putative bifunctional diguanylate cyclase/phosphodiesterase n=1 Tax=Shewanella cyperi TaxID=2814292 RepID=UPI001D186351|nr:GGDEF domain-containing phosphodiesterase [Shewanella cyperi]
MPKLPRLPLALIVPVSVLLIYLCLVTGEFLYEQQQLRDTAATEQTAQIRSQMFRLQHIVESALAVHDEERIEQEVSLASTDLNLMVLVLLDNSSAIRYANHIVWQGSRARLVIDGYEPARHEQVVQGGTPWVAVNPERLSVQAYYPIKNSDPGRFGEVELIYLEYDLSAAFNGALDQLQQRFLRIWGVGALLILVLLALLHVTGIRPLRLLARAAANPSTDAFARPIPLASSEIFQLQGYLGETQSRLERTVKQLRDCEQRWLFAVEGSHNGIWDWQLASDELFLSDRWKDMLGYGPSELSSEYQSWESRIHPEDKDKVLQALYGYLNGESEVYESVHRMRHKQGHYIWVLDRGMLVEWDEQGKPARLIGTHRDISDEVRNQQAIAHQANHDPLTNLANRRAVMDALYDFQQGSGRKTVTRKRLGALMLIDLDNFKIINDALGHHHGDRLLIQVAARLAGAFSGNALVARLGGDEFAVVVLDVSETPEAAAKRALNLAGQIRQLIARSFNLADQQLNVSASVGVCLFDNQQPQEPAQLLRQADMAMYEAKESGRDGCALYSPELDDKASRNLWMQNELRHAISRAELFLVFQPIVDARGELVCAEVLLRWQHPEKGLISPAEFIPVAEGSGLIVEIGQWVLLEVCRVIKRLEAQGCEVPPMAVNISARHFNQQEFAERLIALLKGQQVMPQQLELELTEYALLTNLKLISERMQILRQAGISIAIDDFGTGYSSLSYLQSLPLSRLKLDAAFVSRIGSSDAADAIVRAIIDMAHSLRLAVVAEGVETQLQRDFLDQLQCDFFQGYLFSKPIGEAEFAARLGAETFTQPQATA